MNTLLDLFHAWWSAGWEARCPLTNRSIETDTLGKAVGWFAGECLTWLARQWLIPLGVACVLTWALVRPVLRHGMGFVRRGVRS